MLYTLSGLLCGLLLCTSDNNILFFYTISSSVILLITRQLAKIKLHSALVFHVKRLFGLILSYFLLWSAEISSNSLSFTAALRTQLTGSEIGLI